MFRIKNLLKHETTILGNSVGALKTIDLQAYTDDATIIDSLLRGELYSKIYGKTAAILSPVDDVYSLLNQDQINFIARAGFLMGYKGSDEIKPPLLFNEDGYLQVDVHGISLDVADALDVEGKDAHDSPITANPLLAAAEAKSFTGTALTSVSADQDVTRIAATRQGVVFTTITNPDGSKSPVQADGYTYAAGQGGLVNLSVKRNVLQPNTGSDGTYQTLSSDGYGALYTQLVSIDSTYVTVRTLSTTTADAEPPILGSFIDLNQTHSNSFVEVSYAITAVVGTIPSSMVRFKTWRAASDGSIEKIDEFEIASSYLTLGAATNPLRNRTIQFNGKRIFVTVTFSDGSSPNITGVIKARLLTSASAGLTRSDLVFDPTTNIPIVQPRGYDVPTDSQKTNPLTFECDLALGEVLIVDTTALVAGTEYFYPSADGVEMLPYDSILFEYSVTAANNGYCEIWWESTVGTSSWTQRNVVTTSGYEYNIGARHPSGKINTIINGTLTGQTSFDNVNVSRIRLVVKPITGNSGAVKLNLRRKVRGS